jgi:SAM-dependent methyltransferase
MGSAQSRGMSCEVCGGRDFRCPFTLRRGATEVGYFECIACGLLFQNPMPTREELVAYYSRRDERHVSTYLDKKSYRERIAANRIRRILRVTGKHGRPLEIGSGYGFLLRAARDAGFEETGFEVDWDGIRHATEVLGVNVRPGYFDGTGLTAEYDLVVGIDLFEHIDRPNEFLAAVRRALRPGGLFAFHIPVTHAPGYHVRGRRWRKLNVYEHLFFYNSRNIGIIMGRHGLSRVAEPFNLSIPADFLFDDTMFYFFRKD